MEFTIDDIAKQTGVSKETVRNQLKEMGLYNDLAVKDNRGTRTLTPEQASAVSHALVKAYPAGLKAIQSEAERAERENLSARMIEVMQQTIDNQQGIIDNQKETIESLTRSLEQARADNAEAARKVERLQAAVAELSACHWWEKKSVVAKYALPPASQN